MLDGDNNQSDRSNCGYFDMDSVCLSVWVWDPMNHDNPDVRFWIGLLVAGLILIALVYFLSL